MKELKMLNSMFEWLDENVNTPKGKLLNQLLPIIICAVFYVFFIVSSKYFLRDLINPNLAEKVVLNYKFIDVVVGFFLYFVTAIDYALIIGRMQTSNPGSKARVVMNIATVMGCYAGVTLVLFLWGFAKEIFWLIIPILIFAGSVMIKLAYEGIEYFANSSKIPSLLSNFTVGLVSFLYYVSRIFTFWIPEIAKPSVKPLKLKTLAKWSFILPFIIGLDDLIGYMGAMTIYNVFGLLIGIYFADVLIDIIIFVSPKFTKKLVESTLLSFIATYAFIFLAYKAYAESFHLLHEKYHISSNILYLDIGLFMGFVLMLDLIMAKVQNRRAFIASFTHNRK